MKVCSKCNIEKDNNEFNKKQNWCKSCFIQYQQKYNKTIDKEKIKQRYIKNKEKMIQYNKEHYQYNKDKSAEYYSKNKQKRIEYQVQYHKEKKNNDPYYRFECILRNRIREGFKLYSKNGKTKSCKDYGIDFEAIFNRIGARPEGNYHLDHIIPISVFDLDNLNHIKLAHSPCNLRWLEATDNKSKKDKIDIQLIRCSLALTLIAQEIGLI